MKIKKVINNNLVKTQNEKKQELLVMGCGLGFQKHAGDMIDESKYLQQNWSYHVEQTGD